MRSRNLRGPIRASARAYAWGVLIALAAAAASCSHKPTKPGPPPPVGLGTAVVDTALISPGSELAWSGATGEICYIENFTFEVNGVHASSRVRRRIDGAADQLTLSSTGRWLFYRLLDETFSNTPLVRRDLLGIQRDTLANLVRDFVVSAGDSLIAYTIYHDESALDSLFLLRPATSERTLLTFGLPRAFSPDGKKLLFRERDAQPSDTQVIDLQTLAITPMPLGLPAGSFSYGPRWSAEGLRALYRPDPVPNAPSRIVLRNVTLGTEVDVFSTTDSLDTTFPKWSHDGRKIAFVTHKYTPTMFDYDREASVWSVDVTTRVATLVARGADLPASQTFGVITEFAEFSPDDRALTYVVRSELFRNSIP